MAKNPFRMPREVNVAKPSFGAGMPGDPYHIIPKADEKIMNPKSFMKMSGQEQFTPKQLRFLHVKKAVKGF